MKANLAYHYTEVENVFSIFDSGFISKYKHGYCCASTEKYLQSHIKHLSAKFEVPNHLLHAEVSLTLNLNKIKEEKYVVDYNDYSYLLSNLDLLKHILGFDNYNALLETPFKDKFKTFLKLLKPYEKEAEIIIKTNKVSINAVEEINFYSRYNDSCELKCIKQLEALANEHNLKLNILNYRVKDKELICR